MDVLSPDDCWAVIDLHFKERGLVRQQLDSFDEFMKRQIQEIIDEHSMVVVEIKGEEVFGQDEKADSLFHVLSFGQVYISKPTFTEGDGTTQVLFPNEARLRNLTYGVGLYVDIVKKTVQGRDASTGRTVTSELFKHTFIGHIPVMVKSQNCLLSGLDREDLVKVGECPYDQGGYFIIGGTERIIVAQEKGQSNKIHLYKGDAAGILNIAEVRSQPGPRKGASRIRIKITTGKGRKHQLIRAEIPYVNQLVPVAVLFRALGAQNDKEMMDSVCYDQNNTQIAGIFKHSIDEGASIQTKEAALDYIARRSNTAGMALEERIGFAQNLLDKEVLPHIGTDIFTETRKRFFLGLIVHKVISASLGRLPLTDQDSYGCKRLDLAGPLLGFLFQLMFKKMTKETARYMQRTVYSDRAFNTIIGIKSDIITTGVRYSLATGNWGESKKSLSVRTGVSQVLNRYTYLSSISHLRRITSPIEKEGKLTKPRQLHNTQWGYICPAETPEGQSCGLVKNFSLLATVSVGYSPEPLLAILEELGLENLDEADEDAVQTGTRVFINGKWVGMHSDPRLLAEMLQKQRRAMTINPETSVVWVVEQREINLYTDAGRCLRPVFVVEDNKLRLTGETRRLLRAKSERLTWGDLVSGGVIEYISVEEEETAIICMTPEELDESSRSGASIRYTHCEVHPTAILGISASMIPFSDHNQSPRNTYQLAMAKQAMGVSLTNYQNRLDTTTNILYYPQKPHVTTHAMKYLHFRELPAGQNPVVAIMCFTGYNQEDSLIFSQSAVDRGLFRSFLYTTYFDQENRVGATQKESFEKQDPRTSLWMKTKSYDKLESDGLVAPGTRVTEKDIIIGKAAPLLEKSDELGQRTREHRSCDASTALKATTIGIVDSVILSTNTEGNRFTKTCVRSKREPQVGDKFASRHGQKGTIGMLYRQEDMPFTQEGVIPDIIINPHAIPSRMTIGHLIECLLGKVSACLGVEGNASPFTDVTVDGISEALCGCGYQKRGYEIFYNPMTGHKFEAQIFFGPIYYQRLKHMVDDKIHARARGPVQIMTRQPVEGRSRDGGLRFGEMERDCIISHGASFFLKERLCDVSDAYNVHVCNLCGLFAVANRRRNTYECNICQNKTEITEVCLPYAFKLMVQELLSMGIKACLRV
ncbi:MAG: DNA-directed RNA polymerase II subunit RPB2 [Amphiamblys sp. WSBS2006]|nr:MAG: DNA-directed RNA polymerase II subunit RPB2 [Amphiamblys sp. WSBS2006]